MILYTALGSTNKNKEFSSIWFYLGGRLVTWVTNILYGSKLTDQPTCYKLFKSDILKSARLTENRFGFCSEITSIVLKKGIKIIETPIDYYPRKKHEGKKINWRDGIRAIYIVIKYKFRNNNTNL